VIVQGPLPASGRWSSKVRRCGRRLRCDPRALPRPAPPPPPPAAASSSTNSLGWEGQLILQIPPPARGPTTLALPEAGFREQSAWREEGDSLSVIQVNARWKAGAAPRQVVRRRWPHLILKSLPPLPRPSLQTAASISNTPGRGSQGPSCPRCSPGRRSTRGPTWPVGSPAAANPKFS